MTDFLKKALSLLLLVTFCVSCSDDTLRPETTWLNIYLEDSPADYEKATLQFSSAQMFDGTTWRALTIDKKAISLLELTGGINQSIVSQPIDPGTYTKLKLRLNETGNTLTTGDSVYKLFALPQYEYLEMDMELKVEKDQYNYIYCDIDAARTFKAINDTTFELRPTGRVINPLQYGAVSGFVTDSKNIRLAQTILVDILQDDKTVTTTYTNKENGSFFVRLPQGEYQVSVIPGMKVKFLPAKISGVVVTKATNKFLGNVVLTETTTE